MIRDAVVWLYSRGRSASAVAAAMGLSAFGVSDANHKAHLLVSGEKAVGTVVELVAKPNSAPAQAAKVEGKAEGKAPAGPAAGAGGDDAAAGAALPAARPSCTPVAPKVRYDIGDGIVREHVAATFSCPTSLEPGKRVIVLYDPKRPDDVMLSTDDTWRGQFVFPLAMVGIAGMCLGLAWVMRPSDKELGALLTDPAYAFAADPAHDESRAVALLDGGGPPPEKPLSGIVASAGLIAEGRYPLDLCEFAAYMAALAYHEPLSEKTAKTGETSLEAYLKRTCHPHITNVGTFSNEGTEGFGFLLDGAAFIVMRGTMGWSDWGRNLKAGTTGPAEFLPPEPGWQNPPKPAGWKAPPRHFGFAQGWDVIRRQVEDWVESTPLKDKQPFIFTGHSLGGALSFLGAYEFATRGRDVAAVVTFGAAIPGKSGFKAEYDALGLSRKTLRLEFTQDIVPEAQKLIGYREVGVTWEPQRLPLISQNLALASVPFNWIVGRLGSSLVIGKKKDDGGRAAAAPQERRVEGQPLSVQVRRWLLRLVIFLAFSSVLALAAHKMQRRYAMALSIMSYRRIRARHIAAETAAGRTGVEPPDFKATYEQMRRHLQAVRGSTPEAPELFATIPNLPRPIDGPGDLKWLNAFHAARLW